MIEVSDPETARNHITEIRIPDESQIVFTVDKKISFNCFSCGKIVIKEKGDYCALCENQQCKRLYIGYL